MARGLFCAAMLLAPAAARAQCQVDGIQFFPAPGSVIPTNTHFILEGVGPDQQRVLSLVGEMVTFKTADDIILGKVRQGWRSEMNRAAVVIVPNHTFLHNRKYTLELGGALARAKVLNETPGTWGGPQTSGRPSGCASRRWRKGSTSTRTAS
jgi:hypothetical protein